MIANFEVVYDDFDVKSASFRYDPKMNKKLKGHATKDYIDFYDKYSKLNKDDMYTIEKFSFTNCVVDFSGFSSRDKTKDISINNIILDNCKVISFENLKYFNLNKLSIKKNKDYIKFSDELISSLDGISYLLIDDSCYLPKYPHVKNTLFIRFFEAKEQYEVILSDKEYNKVILDNVNDKHNNIVNCLVRDSPKINELLLGSYPSDRFSIDIENPINIKQIKKLVRSGQ